MKVFATKANKHGSTQVFTAHCHKDGSYKLYPKSCNQLSKAKVVHTLEDAANWLATNEGWGIRMSNGQGDAPSIIFKDIQVVS